MSGDFEPWNNSPSTNEAPKLEKTPYSDDKNHGRKIGFIVWVDLLLGLLFFAGLLWWFVYRHHP